MTFRISGLVPLAALALCALPVTGIVSVATAPQAMAQMDGRPWGFNPQNRASIAALMKQVEGTSGASATAAAQAGGVTQLICGGGGQPNAAGNSSCIILNNAAGDIQIGQDSIGSQEATSDTETVVNNPEDSSLGDVLGSLTTETSTDD